MAFSGTVSTTTFNTQKVVDAAFRRCRVLAQNISAEMLSYAQDALYLLLSELANGKTPSWCIERTVLPMYQNNPLVELPLGTVNVLNLNYRQLQEATGTTTSSATEYKVDFASGDASQATINVVGVKWSGAGVAVTLQTSPDDATWTTVGTIAAGASAGDWSWVDIDAALPRQYFRLTSVAPMLLDEVYLGTLPQEIPMGALNKDGYVAQSNKAFSGRPSNYWFQRDLPQPVVHLWPAPAEVSEHAQLVLWAHRHIMDVGTLAQSVEIPQRWNDAIVAKLAHRVAMETPQVDAQLIPMLKGEAAEAETRARDGDNDGSPMWIQPSIGMYTR